MENSGGRLLICLALIVGIILVLFKDLQHNESNSSQILINYSAALPGKSSQLPCEKTVEKDAEINPKIQNIVGAVVDDKKYELENRKLKDEIKNTMVTNKQFEKRNQDLMNQQVQNNEKIKELMDRLAQVTQKLDETEASQKLEIAKEVEIPKKLNSPQKLDTPRNTTQEYNTSNHLATVSFSEEFIPQLYAITPTYKRATEKSDLTSILQAMRLSNVRIQMVLVEDTIDSVNNPVLQHFADRWNSKEPSNIRIHLLKQNTIKKNNRHRGVFQRNAGLNWVMENNKNTSAAVYLADDDNTYDERLFQEFVKIGRNKKTIMGVLPVGLVGGGSWEGPICQGGQVKGYHSLYKPSRTFALDMAGFAFTVQALIDSKAQFSQDWMPGTLETMFAASVAGGKTGPLRGSWPSQRPEIRERVAPLGESCTKVYVWHTKTTTYGTHKIYGDVLEVKK